MGSFAKKDIWDSIAQVPESVSLTEEEKAEIDRRLDAYHNNPDAGSPWLMVRERIKSREIGSETIFSSY